MVKHRRVERPSGTLKVPSSVRDVIRHLHPVLKKRVRAALADLLLDPTYGKPLKGELDGYWSLRVGRHRIVYRPDREGLEVVAVGPRQTIYEHTVRLLIRGTRRRQRR